MPPCERTKSDWHVSQGQPENAVTDVVSRSTGRRRSCRRTSSMLVAVTVLPDLVSAHRPARPVHPSTAACHPLTNGRSRCGHVDAFIRRNERRSRLDLASSTWTRSVHCSTSVSCSTKCMSRAVAPACSSLPSEGRGRRLAFISSGVGLQTRLPRCRGGAGGAACRGQRTGQVFQPHAAGRKRNDNPSSNFAEEIDERQAEKAMSIGCGGDVNIRRPLPSCHPAVQVEADLLPRATHGHHAGAATAEASRPQPLPVPPRQADDVAKMKALGKDGKWRQALDVLERLKEDAAASGDRSLFPGLEVFNAAIAAVSRSGKWEEALGLLEGMRSAGVAPDVVTFTSVVSAASRSGRVASAEQLLRSMRLEGVFPNTATYNAAISGCSAGGEWKRALRLLREMEANPRGEARPEPLSYSLVLKACARDGQWETSLELLEEMQAKGLQPTVFSFRYALAAFCSSSGGERAGDWRRCLSLMGEMDRQGVAPDAPCYKHAVDIAAKAGEVDAALELLDRMESSGGVRDPSPYNQIIVALGLRREWKRALSILERARSSGARRDVRTFAVAMTACARGGAPREAFRLLAELKREGRSGGGGDVLPNTVVYNTLLALCKGKPLSRDRRDTTRGMAVETVEGNHNGGGSHGLGVDGGVAFAVADTAGAVVGGAACADTPGVVLEEEGDGDGARNAVESDWGRRPDELVAKAVGLLHEMTLAGGQSAPDKMSFELAMQACVNAGRPKNALKVFDAMRRWTATLATPNGGGGGAREVGAAARRIRVKPERATYRLGLTAAAAAGDGEAAAEMLNDMRCAGIVVDESTLHLAATAFGRAGLWREGVILTRTAAEEGVRVSPSTVTSVLGACARAGRWEEALEVLDRARPDLREAISRETSLADGGARRAGDAIPAYTLAMAACRVAGRPTEGLEVFWIMEEDGGRGDRPFFLATLACCASCAAFEAEDSTRRADGSGGEQGRGSPWGRTCGATVADRVLKLASAQGHSLGMEGLTDAARAFGHAGKWEDALALLYDATAAGVEPDERMYCAVIDAMGENGAWREVVELVQALRTRATSNTAGELESDPDKLSEKGCCSPDNRGRQALLLALPPPSWPRRAVYGCACRACAHGGDWRAVLALIDGMRRDGVDRDPAVYASAMRAFVEAGEWERAVELVTVEMELDGVSPDVRSYSQALRACRMGASGDGRAARLAQALVSEMEEKGLGRDMTCLEGAARACLADGRSDLGLDFVSQALEDFRRNSAVMDLEGEERGSLDAQRLETIKISLLGRCGRWEEALDTLDTMREEHGPRLDERAFVFAARACAFAGKWPVVQVLLSEVSSVALSEDASLVSPGALWDMRRALLAGLAAAGLWRRAVREIREMYGQRLGRLECDGGGLDRYAGLQEREYAGLQEREIRAGISAREALVRRRQRRMLKDYRTVMHSCLRARAWDQVLYLWSELTAQQSRHAPRLKPCAATYALVLRACGALGCWTAARDLVTEMRSAGGELAPGTAHYALAACAAAVADDEIDEASSGREWGEAGERRGSDGRGNGVEEGEEAGGTASRYVGSRGVSSVRDTRLRGLLAEMVADGVAPGWELYAAVCWARSQQKRWCRASLGVLELMDEVGLGDASVEFLVFAGGDSGHGAAAVTLGHRRAKMRSEGVQNLYARLLAAAGKVPHATVEGQEPGYAVRRVLIDANERLGSAGPQVYAAAARAFARARDWQGARDSALRLLSFERSSLEAIANTASAVSDAISAAVGACARAGELDEAESLVNLARNVATDSVPVAIDGGEGDHVRSDLEGFAKPDGAEPGAGLDRKACLELAKAYERIGRLGDAEALRLHLRGALAARFGVETVGAGESPPVAGAGRRRFDGKELRRSLSNYADSHGGGKEEVERLVPNGAYEDSGGHADDEDSFLDWIGTDGAYGGGIITPMATDVEDEWWEDEAGGVVGSRPREGRAAGGRHEVLVRELEGL